MRRKDNHQKDSAEKTVRDIRRATRRRFSAEEKVRIVLEGLREQIGKHPVNVFSYRGNPIKQLDTKAWRAALERAGIEDFRWHDLRHTWASWHVQAGTPLHVLQELGGWESVEMVRRYAHLSSDHLVEYVDRMSGSLKAVNGREGVTNQLRAAE